MVLAFDLLGYVCLSVCAELMIPELLLSWVDLLLNFQKKRFKAIEWDPVQLPSLHSAMQGLLLSAVFASKHSTPETGTFLSLIYFCETLSEKWTY